MHGEVVTLTFFLITDMYHDPKNVFNICMCDIGTV